MYDEMIDQIYEKFKFIGWLLDDERIGADGHILVWKETAVPLSDVDYRILSLIWKAIAK